MTEIEADAVLFDLDGVLANSNATVEHAWRVWAAEKDLDASEIIAYAHGRRTTESLDRFLPGVAQAPEIERLLALEEDALDLVSDIPGARELVAALHGARWAVATSGEERIALPRLRKAGIPPPPALVTAEQVAHGKPDPEVYLAAAAALGVDPRRCVVFEDTPAGIEAGRRAGARVVALLTTFPASALRGADAIVRDFHAVHARLAERTIRLAVDPAG